MNAAWPVQDAKNKLSELIDTVASEGPQTITRHGRPVAVVVSPTTFANLQPREKLADILLDCPVKDWMPERNKETARNITLG